VDVDQKGGNVARNVAQTDVNVAKGEDNVAQNLDDCITALIQETPNIKREEMAQRLSVTKKTIERHLRNLKISWEGHPKTGHWLLPKKE
ncbi:MAG: HTH domain-containing protein, partial [Muribaculaceae bacterium]|nr:HTH domain-containing protein [Muribaculaceae bacterium]